MNESTKQLRGVSIPMPNGSTVWTELMTPEEACAYLRLRKTAKQADTTMRYYVNMGMIKPVQVGGQNRFTVTELDEFVKRQQNRIG